MATNYSINYNDDRFKQVEQQQNEAINKSNQMYDQMINDSQTYYQNQINAVNDYATTQQQLQQEKTDQAIAEINQQKEYLNKDYTREQKGAYADWQKESNRYGVNAEQQAASGLANTGYSESSQVAMYNQYQNRVATARESYQRAVVDYDNAIANARISNNAALAEIAYNALQNTLELSLEGFQYKNTLLQTRLNAEQQLNSEYYQRYQNVLSQMNTENALAEQIRQYNTSLKEKQRQYNETMKYNKAQAKQQQKNWEKEYALSLKASRAGGPSGPSGPTKKKDDNTINLNGSSGQTIKTNYYNGTINPDAKNGTFKTTDKNGVRYQPNNIGGVKLKSSGKTVGQMTGDKEFKNSSGVNVANQKVWQIGNQYYIWNGSKNKYEKLSAK